MRYNMNKRNFLAVVCGLVFLTFIYFNTSLFRESTENEELDAHNHQKIHPEPKNVKVESKEQKQGEELLAVYVLARHGARTPLHLLPGVEEASYSPDLTQPFVMAHLSLRELNGSEFKHGLSHADKTSGAESLKGGAPRGRLTKVGEKQLFDLGLRMREKYIKKLNFIKDKYDYNEIFVRSSHYLRTIDSAKSFLTGFYGKHPIDLNDYAYVIHLKKYEDDSIFPNPTRCKYLKAFRAEQLEEKLYKDPEYTQNLKEMYTALGIADQHNPAAFTDFRDDFSAREVHDLPIPADIKPLIKKYDKFAAKELALHCLESDVRLTSGPILNEFKDGLLSVIESDSKDRDDYHKFNYYSNHDSTVMAVLIALGLINEQTYHWPPFASTIAFELWKDFSDNNYFVRVFYCEKPVKLPGCTGTDTDTTRCSLKELLNVISKYSLTPSEYDTLCDRKYPAN